MYSPEVYEAIKAHMISEAPREACGLVVETLKGTRYIPCHNAAVSGEDFKLTNQDWIAAEELGEIVGIIHSHPDESAEPSEADRKACEEHGIPWVICSVREGKITEVKVLRPSGWKAPLVGRNFYHGVLDCLTLIQDWFLRERGIVLKDYEREDDWWSKGGNMYVDLFEETGFVNMGQNANLQVGDVILMQIRSKVPNHGAIYIGDSKLTEAPELHNVYDAMLHHLYGRLSTREVYGGYWRQITTHILRHKELM